MGLDATGAVIALQSAGNDVEALALAIKEAAFLDATPGNNRQKLRGISSLFVQCYMPFGRLRCLEASAKVRGPFSAPRHKQCVSC